MNYSAFDRTVMHDFIVRRLLDLLDLVYRENFIPLRTFSTQLRRLRFKETRKLNGRMLENLRRVRDQTLLSNVNNKLEHEKRVLPIAIYYRFNGVNRSASNLSPLNLVKLFPAAVVFSIWMSRSSLPRSQNKNSKRRYIVLLF